MRPFRRELKFLVHHQVKDALLGRWSRYLIRDPHTNENAVTPILSQYYDSPDLTFYWEKLDGIGLRNKVRLRTYGTHFRPNQATFLEIKHRQNDLVRKFRYPLPDYEPGQLDPAQWKIDDPQLEAFFMTLRERYRLRASAQTYYQREAYQGLVEKDVRVTFDSNLIGMHPGEELSREIQRDRSRHLMPDSLVILEVKATRGIPPWVHDGVVGFELQQKTIPKYVTAVEMLGMAELNEAGVYA